eukprot:Blabericola_migrator_1__9488@NODE_5153_length_859_cov_42_093434_g1734_i1_p1_GENE_NODE_5153_length_859_cov_42_093434_g1734_i1NODE_5153_length_859_cov_42_093434_g1734_i1_p1_ORF_typecomplete_len107_score20_63ACOX/PF01756_19/0_074Eclosion/PF04736_12/49Eclosion/PF04736_12/1_NODE_5153_length_859_cov_42_093434_g1734_i1131451
MESGTSLVGDISDWANVVSPLTFTCDCDHPCYKVAGNVPPSDCAAIRSQCDTTCAEMRPSSIPIVESTESIATPDVDLDYKEVLLEEQAEARETKVPNLGHIYPVV